MSIQIAQNVFSVNSATTVKWSKICCVITNKMSHVRRLHISSAYLSTASKASRINYRLLTTNDEDEVVGFLSKHYTANSPFNKVMKIESHELRYEFATVKTFLDQGYSIGAFATKYGLCGLQINVSNRDLNPLDIKERKMGGPKDERIERLFENFVDNRSLPKLLGTDNYWEHRFGCVVPEYGQRGIKRELFLRSINLAESRGCDVVFARTGSYFSYRAAMSLGYKTLHQVYYKDCVDPVTGKKEFEDIEDPHHFIALVCKNVASGSQAMDGNFESSESTRKYIRKESNYRQ